MSETPGYGHQLRKQVANSQKPDPQKVSEQITQMLGFVANQYTDIIIHDLFLLIDKGQSRREELDGYVKALCRCMAHDLAWHCISDAFHNSNQTIPDQYYSLFNRERKDDKNPPPSMRVE